VWLPVPPLMVPGPSPLPRVAAHSSVDGARFDSDTGANPQMR